MNQNHPPQLHVTRWGNGEPVVLVHGSISTGVETWQEQRPLAERGFELVVPDRRGYGGSAALADGEDYSVDADDVAGLLGDGAHLVGHSYGGISALLAAAAHPDRVRSLTVVEPPAFSVAGDDPAVATMVAESQTLWARRDLSDRAFLEGFLALLGSPPEELPGELLEHWAAMTGPLRHCAPPWAAEIPLARLAAAPHPMMVVSGRSHPAFDAVCTVLATALGARHEVVLGAGHEAQSTGRPFNELLLGLWQGHA